MKDQIALERAELRVQLEYVRAMLLLAYQLKDGKDLVQLLEDKQDALCCLLTSINYN